MTKTETPDQRSAREAHARAVADAAHREPYVPTQAPDTFLHRHVLPNAGGLLALALLPVTLVAHISVWSWVIVMGVWLVNRVANMATMRMVDGLPQTIAVGAAGFGMMLRVWTIALVLFFVGAELQVGSTQIGAGRRDIAVPAMLLFMLVLTVDIAVRGYAELHRYRSGDAAAPSTDPAREDVAP